LSRRRGGASDGDHACSLGGSSTGAGSGSDAEEEIKSQLAARKGKQRAEEGTHLASDAEAAEALETEAADALACNADTLLALAADAELTLASEAELTLAREAEA